MKNKTYLFDFDGTLVDSMPAFSSMVIRILEENSIKYPKDIVKIVTPLGVVGTAEYFIKLGVNNTVSGVIKKMDEYSLYDYENTIQLKDNVKETLIALKNQGASLNVLTASPHLNLDDCLKRLEVYDLFDNVWSCDDFNTSKSNPEIYKIAAERLNKTVGDVIFVDDNVNAVKTAKTAGMISYGIYDESSKDYIAEMQEIADEYVMNFKELLNK